MQTMTSKDIDYGLVDLERMLDLLKNKTEEADTLEIVHLAVSMLEEQTNLSESQAKTFSRLKKEYNTIISSVNSEVKDSPPRDIEHDLKQVKRLIEMLNLGRDVSEEMKKVMGHLNDQEDMSPTQFKEFTALKAEYKRLSEAPKVVASPVQSSHPPKSTVEEIKSKQAGGEQKQPPLPDLPPQARKTPSPPPVPQWYKDEGKVKAGSQASSSASSSQPKPNLLQVDVAKLSSSIDKIQSELKAKVDQNAQKAAAEAERADEAAHQKARIGAGLRNESANRDREKARVAEQAAETKAAEQAVRTARAQEVGEDWSDTVGTLSVMVSNCLDDVGPLSKAASQDKRVSDFVQAFEEVNKEVQAALTAEVEQRNNPNPKASPSPGIVQAAKLNNWVTKVAEACDTFTNPPQGVLAKGLAQWHSFKGKNPAVEKLKDRIEDIIARNDEKLFGLTVKAGVVLTHDLRQHGVTGLKGSKQK